MSRHGRNRSHARASRAPMPRGTGADCWMRLGWPSPSEGPARAWRRLRVPPGVGIGTLYRHFPTRDALVEQVYRDEAEQLAEAARRLAMERPPLEALRRWLLLFVDYLVTKRSMAELLNAPSRGPAALYASSTALVKDAVAALVDRAAASGAARVAVEPLDLLRALAGRGHCRQPAPGGPTMRGTWWTS